MITYLVNGRAYFEAYEYSTPGILNTIAFPTEISAPSNIAPCSSPNVAMSYSGIHVVFTWAQGARIYGRYYNVTSGLSPVYNITNNACFMISGGLHSKPDVAINEQFDSFGFLLTRVSFVFINQTSTVKDITLVQIDLLNIVNNIPYNCIIPQSIWTLTSIPLGDGFSPPRIAAPPTYFLFHPNDFEAVVAHYRLSNTYIYGFTHFASVYGSSNIITNTLNNSPNITTCGNFDPVVTYAGDNIIAAWTYDDGSCNSINGSKEVIAKQLDWAGVPTFNPASNPVYGYSIVNINTAGIQHLPSIAGTFSSGLALYTFYSPPAAKILYKTSFYANTSLKWEEETATEVLPVLEKTNRQSIAEVWPNPFSEKAKIITSIAEGETGKSLEIYNLFGQRVTQFEMEGLQSGKYEFNWDMSSEHLPAGIYFLRYSTDHSNQVLKLNKAY